MIAVAFLIDGINPVVCCFSIVVVGSFLRAAEAATAAEYLRCVRVADEYAILRARWWASLQGNG
jgi:hypothetical protein